MNHEDNGSKIGIFAGSPIQNMGGGEKDALGVAKILGDVVIFPQSERR